MDVLDFEKGSNLKIKLKDKNNYFVGHLKNIEENGMDSWIAISAYVEVDATTGDMLEPNYLKNPDIILVLKLADVEYVTVYN